MQNHQRSGLDQSDLNRIIAPEIKNDDFYELIKRLAATETLEAVLEIGSSAGGGSTEAFVEGLSQNPKSPKLFCIEISKPRFEKLREAYKFCPFVHCYNLSSVSADQFPSPETVATFYREVPSGLRKFPLSLVLDWLRQDIQYVREAGVESGAIAKIKADHAIEVFDMVLIDGSEFTGEVEFAQLRDSKLILLDDTNSFKCYNVRQSLLNDPMYDLITDDQQLRNGYSVFRRRATARNIGGILPIHFFTIVLNGEPFIRYHEEVFRRLIVPWHWHVVEGVAALNHDTAWSVATGGRIPDSVHHRGRSNDGTSAYLDELKQRFPENVTIYRKPMDEFWDGKIEMVNAPLPSIREVCLLWQIDTDELWTVEQILTVHKLFNQNPDRMAAYYWCWYYVGPDKIISTRYNYAQNPKKEWLRTWRYAPGAVWATHEPPVLLTTTKSRRTRTAADVAKFNTFSQDDMEQAGVVFQHFAYATESQLAFKELYYGYNNALSKWRALQAHKGSGQLRDFFGWVSDNTMFDDAARYLIGPLAKPDSVGGRWTFDGIGRLPKTQSETAVKRPRIVVDGIYCQYLSSEIRRVWENLLREWITSGFSDQVIVLDRAGTASRIAGVHYWTIAKHDYLQTGRDSLYLETVCRRLDADLFVSTYYSTPVSTPSFFSGYDMIPEVLGFPLEDEVWQEKRRAIVHAIGHSMISRNSAEDLERLYPELPRGRTYVTKCGVAPFFKRPDADEVNRFRASHGLQKLPYVLIVGERLGCGGYKNGALAFRALAALPDDKPLSLICAGGHQEIETQLRELAPNLDVRRLALNDTDLRAAYGGAHALLYPSKYEGFGLPPLESMACGTPAIVCHNSSLPEVVGDAAIYVDENDATEMTDAILQLFDPALRAGIVERGSNRASQFTFAQMAAELASALVETDDRLKAGELTRPSAAWAELRAFQQACQAEDRRWSSAHRPLMQSTTGERNSPIRKGRELIARVLRKPRKGWRVFKKKALRSYLVLNDQLLKLAKEYEGRRARDREIERQLAVLRAQQCNDTKLKERNEG
jgi:glycosyltransferase involved in cell wall biosynthesis